MTNVRWSTQMLFFSLQYHVGFRHQVLSWPKNPVDYYIDKFTSYPQQSIIADLGCGDAKLASELQKELQRLNVKILSYDLHSPSPLVQRADIANLPLEDGSVNIAVAAQFEEALSGGGGIGQGVVLAGHYAVE